MLLRPLILMCWSRFHGHGPWARSQDPRVSWYHCPVQIAVRNHARVWDLAWLSNAVEEVCSMYRGPLMSGGNLGNWIKSEHDLYIWEFYVIITESYKCTMSAICMQSTTGSTVTQFICSQNCEIDANITRGWLCMSGIQGLLCYQCWFLSLLLSALSSSVAATNH